MDIEQLDRNFSLINKVNELDCVFYNVKNEPFEIHGLYNPKNEGSFEI